MKKFIGSVKLFFKCVVRLCKVGVVALKLWLLDKKYSRLIRKNRIFKALDVYEKMMLLANEGMSICDNTLIEIENKIET